MVKILYGVAGEGMGHATRASVIIKHLIKQGHTMHVVTSNRAYDFLCKSFPKLKITKIPGLILVYEDNSLNQLKSALVNIKPKEGIEAFEIVKKIIKDENVEFIITDFEPTVAYLAGIIGLSSFKTHIPLLSIDNIHFSSNSDIDVPLKFKKYYIIQKLVNKFVIPYSNVDKYLITAFFSPKINNEKTEFIPLIVRDEILNKKTKEKNHILVYQTSKSNTKMFDELKKFNNENFIVYGFDEDKKELNIIFKKFGNKDFISDFANSKAVITNGGFSLISEAIFMHKPILSIPVKKQFEQICNAIYLEKKGYGLFCKELTKQDLNIFLQNLPLYKKNLAIFKQKDNKKSFEKIDKTIHDIINKTI